MPTNVQTTIRKAIDFGEGVGLHSGQIIRMRCLPARDDSGIVFRRVDLPGQPQVQAHIDYLDQAALVRQTSLVDGSARVGTVEHILACCLGLGIDNLIIELNGPEVPMHDGSAVFVAKGLFDSGIAELSMPRHTVHIPHPILFELDAAEVTALPADTFQAAFFAEFEHPAIGHQNATFAITPETFLAELAPARTFCTLEDVESLRQAGLIRGGSIDSAVVFGPDGPVETTLRFANEPARHKLLDLLGDLCLLSPSLEGIIMASRSGHRVHAAFVRQLQKELVTHEQLRSDSGIVA